MLRNIVSLTSFIFYIKYLSNEDNTKGKNIFWKILIHVTLIKNNVRSINIVIVIM